MLLVLPAEIRVLVLSHLPYSSQRTLIASSKAFRSTAKLRKNPTHKEQADMLEACDFHWSLFDACLVLPFDNPHILQFYRAWQTVDRRALMHWINSQRIQMDEGGLYARVPWRCELLDSNGVSCRRIRVRLWERVNTRHESLSPTRGEMITTWNLLPGFSDRAYNRCERQPRRPAACKQFDQVRYCLRPLQ